MKKEQHQVKVFEKFSFNKNKSDTYDIKTKSKSSREIVKYDSCVNIYLKTQY